MTSESGYKTALVTGASRGIGAAIVERLRARGLDVFAAARSADDLDALASRTGCKPLPLDATDAIAVERELGTREIDVLVNNVGGVPAVGPFAQRPYEEAESVIGLNLLAAMACTRAVLPGMIERRRGHVFFLGSLFGPYPAPNVAAYAAAKSATRTFCACLRMELAGSNVRITEVAPGRVATEFFREAMGGDAAAMREKLHTRHRSLHPDDVAEILVAALDLPPRADASLIELSPTDQAMGGVLYPEKVED